ncbi:DUF882 domain-containing protein [Rhizobium sp. ICMP 5592]|uniref:DUF882 domain-containing protein n=1 Tax=Rhizobium sp. ICMP 5592 TaxID=2292445 RepID=UPI001295DDDC|nr:DUF882 domain-containing protein [Rhizobium sp. ICMP 5592]MQB41971.1 DUF882 domain-containing protein [Rhizobium sp. ICMP 5592]
MPNLSGNTKPNSLSWHSACSEIFRKVAKVVAVGLLAMAVSTPVFVGSPTKASGETRSLKIYFVHTGEKAVITYKRDGKFDPAGLEKLNRILRDWRKNQPTKMNPHLFDLIWQVYRNSGSSDFIYVVCGFRSPGTNEMLRTRSAHTGVAKKSQHMLGNAMDFYIPDVKLTKLREIGMKLQVGGVGYYPTSGSPFVHMDVGGVRAWPRMDRQELVRLFPDGKTMHIPADGRPLPGYQQAVADYKRRVSSDDIQIASSSSPRRGFFARLFGGGGADEEEDNADTGAPAAAAPTTLVAKNTQRAPVAADDGDDSQPVPVTQVASVNAPVPQVRPAFGNQAGSEVASALMSPPRNAAQDALAAAMPTTDAQQQQYADLRDYRVPVPALLNRRTPGDAEMASAESEVTDQAVGVPVPVERPEIAENLLASADADPDAIDDAADQGTLSPAIVAALEQRRADQADANAGVAVNTVANNVASKDEVPPANNVAADNDAVRAIAAVLPQKRPVQPMPMQVAALAPTASEIKASSRRFNDSFEVMAPQERPVAAGVATKGGRPNKQDAVVADSGRAAVTTPPKLTDKMISQWAIANARVEIVNRPVKAPRFVSPTLRAQPTAVYTDGFKVQTASMDPERFSGTAVNFLQVKKFNSVE